MNKKEKKIILARIEKWYSKLPNLFFQHQKKFSAKYGWSKKLLHLMIGKNFSIKLLKRNKNGEKNGKVRGFI